MKGQSSRSFDLVPRRIFLDSCTVQMMRDYAGFIYEYEPISETDRINSITNGLSNLDALRNIFSINERACFEWIVTDRSLQEAAAKNDEGHMRWLLDIADHSAVCLEEDSATTESKALGERLDETRFGYISSKDRELLRHALILRCDAFLTVEKRLPQNSAHFERETGLRILTPVAHWEIIEPWAALWR